MFSLVTVFTHMANDGLSSLLAYGVFWALHLVMVIMIRHQHTQVWNLAILINLLQSFSVNSPNTSLDVPSNISILLSTQVNGYDLGFNLYAFLMVLLFVFNARLKRSDNRKQLNLVD